MKFIWHGERVDLQGTPKVISTQALFKKSNKELQMAMSEREVPLKGGTREEITRNKSNNLKIC